LSAGFSLGPTNYKEIGRWDERRSLFGGFWLTQLEEHVTLDLRVVSSSPTVSVEIT